MKVYLVTATNYDDCSHLAAFSTREAAEALAERLREMDRQRHGLNSVLGDDYSVDEVAVDPPLAEQPGAWVVHLNDAGEHTHGSPYFTSAAAPADPAQIYTHSEQLFSGYGESAELAYQRAEALRRQTLG